MRRMVLVIVLVVSFFSVMTANSKMAFAEDDEFTFGDVFVQKKGVEKVTFHGYVAFQYFDVEGGNGSFDQHIFEPFFGYQVNDKVFAKLIFELEHAPEKVDDSQYAELFIEQAEIDIVPFEGLSVGFGAILVPFGLENYLHAPSDNPLITRPPVVKSGENGNPVLNNTWTDVGIQLNYMIPDFGVFDFYVINGSALQTKSTRGRDTKGPNANHGKSFGAEIQITKLVPGFNFGVSYVSGKHDASNQLDSWRAGVHVMAQLNPVYFSAEYMTGTDEGVGTVNTDADLSGYYVIASLMPELPMIKDRLAFSIRYSGWTADDDAGMDYSEMAYGLRYRLYEQTWAKVEYQVNNEDGNSTETDNNRFGLQLNVLF